MGINSFRRIKNKIQKIKTLKTKKAQKDSDAVAKKKGGRRNKILVMIFFPSRSDVVFVLF